MIQSISTLKKYSVFLWKNAARIGVVKVKENVNRIGYYSVIPATVLYNKELKANEKFYKIRICRCNEFSSRLHETTMILNFYNMWKMKFY